jgi:hypothetical protein
MGWDKWTISRNEKPGYGLDDRVFKSRKGLGIFLFTTVSNRLWGSPSLLSNG